MDNCYYIIEYIAFLRTWYCFFDVLFNSIFPKNDKSFVFLLHSFSQQKCILRTIICAVTCLSDLVINGCVISCCIDYIIEDCMCV